MMQSLYTKLFSLEVQHTYFENSVCTCLVFAPSPSTMNLLLRYGFRLKAKPDGFELYSSSATPSGFLDFIDMTNGQSCFEFNIISTNPDFSIFTDGPASQLGMRMYDSSNSVNENGKVLLHETFVPEQDISVVGNLKIQFGDIVNNQTSNPPAYLIQLEARSTQWQYYIISRNAMILANPSITSKDGISFTGPESVTIQSGQQALLFSSGESLIPLSQQPKQRFDLVDNPAPDNQQGQKRNSPKIIYKGLPNADPKFYGITEVNGSSQVTSPMYVYV